MQKNIKDDLGKDVFAINEIIWAKLGGWPWWPAKIFEIKEEIVSVKFIGEKSHANVKRKTQVKKWKDNYVHFNYTSKKNKNLAFSVDIANKLLEKKITFEDLERYLDEIKQLWMTNNQEDLLKIIEKSKNNNNNAINDSLKDEATQNPNLEEPKKKKMLKKKRSRFTKSSCVVAENEGGMNGESDIKEEKENDIGVNMLINNSYLNRQIKKKMKICSMDSTEIRDFEEVPERKISEKNVELTTNEIQNTDEDKQEKENEQKKRKENHFETQNENLAPIPKLEESPTLHEKASGSASPNRRCEPNIQPTISSNQYLSNNIETALSSLKPELEKISCSFDLIYLILESINTNIQLQPDLLTSHLDLIKSILEYYSQISDFSTINNQKIQSLLNKIGAFIHGKEEYINADSKELIAYIEGNEIKQTLIPEESEIMPYKTLYQFFVEICNEIKVDLKKKDILILSEKGFCDYVVHGPFLNQYNFQIQQEIPQVTNNNYRIKMKSALEKMLSLSIQIMTGKLQTSFIKNLTIFLEINAVKQDSSLGKEYREMIGKIMKKIKVLTYLLNILGSISGKKYPYYSQSKNIGISSTNYSLFFKYFSKQELKYKYFKLSDSPEYHMRCQFSSFF